MISLNKLIILTSCIWSLSSFAQITPSQLQYYISNDNNLVKINRKYVSQIKYFYSKLNYKTAWIQKQNSFNSNYLLASIKRSPELGLTQKDYHSNYIESVCNGNISLQNISDSLQAEVILTEAAIHFYNDIAYGNAKPSFEYNGFKNATDCRNVPVLLADHISNSTLPLLIFQLSFTIPEINVIQNTLKKIHTVMSDSNFREVVITSNKISTLNIPLTTKLHQLGIIDSINKIIPEDTLKQKIKDAQQKFGLLNDGILRSTIINELNVPLSVRFQQLTLSINYYRWLYCYTQNQSVIVVNIPATYLKVYQNNKTILEMRIVVGKKSTPTPTLTSTVNEVILYPYWHVPYSIATREILPILKRYPGYINVGNYQVLNKEGKIINPYSINWNALSTKNFPYVIRQSTGCDNALGLLKLNFYSPFGVYLHDTPNKTLFMLNKRYASHGCMRMEKPMELGHLILKSNSIAIDTLEQKGCLRNRAPITVPVTEPMPVVVWYNPAGIDSLGKIVFYEDVYKKFNWINKN